MNGFPVRCESCGVFGHAARVCMTTIVRARQRLARLHLIRLRARLLGLPTRLAVEPNAVPPTEETPS